MLFAAGTRVRMKHTGDEGVVSSILENGMVNVYIASEDMEIPVFSDDLENIEDVKRETFHKPEVKAKVVKAKQPKIELPPERPASHAQYAIFRSLGIQLAFDPVEVEGANHYDLYLINDTPYDVIFTFQLNIKEVLKQKINSKLASVSVTQLGELPFDRLNDYPVIELECWQLTTAGTGKRLHKEVKIKPQQFFKRFKTAPILNKQVYHYVIFENFDKEEKTEEDLKTYTKRNALPGRRNETSYAYYDRHNVSEFANFKLEIDLHIEKLTDREEGMTNAEKLKLQLRNFDDYIEKAGRLGVDRVFVIHGVGKGRLRDEIATRLLQNPYVASFKNDFHPRYGHGATEVIF